MRQELLYGAGAGCDETARHAKRRCVDIATCDLVTGLVAQTDIPASVRVRERCAQADGVAPAILRTPKEPTMRRQ